MSLYTKSFLLLFVFMLLSASNVLGKTHVSITNHLDRKQDLVVHCRSADDDLGVHSLHFNQTFGWRFGISIFSDTQFYCSFRWKNAPLVWYDVYIKSRDKPICDECNWYIREGGPCSLQIYEILNVGC
ncbi:Plant self-incompatibility S1 [Spatholobus suberectus]|nr:Plant self-incompatibility S1 [Spatholobus suberectus]